MTRKSWAAEWLIKQAENFRPPETANARSVPDKNRHGSSILALIGSELSLVQRMAGPDHPVLHELANQHSILQELLWEKLQKPDYQTPLAAVVPREIVPLETQCRFAAGPTAHITISDEPENRGKISPHWMICIHRHNLSSEYSYLEFLLGASAHGEIALSLEAALACMRSGLGGFSWSQDVFAGDGNCLIKPRKDRLEITRADPHDNPNGRTLGLTCDCRFPMLARAAT